MQELDLHDMWFQQDGATCHTERVTMDLLRGEFVNILFHVRDRSIGYLDRAIYFLWVFVKDHASTDKPASIDAFEMLERVYQNWTKQMEHLRRSRDQYLHEIIFKH